MRSFEKYCVTILNGDLNMYQCLCDDMDEIYFMFIVPLATENKMEIINSLFMQDTSHRLPTFLNCPDRLRGQLHEK